MFNHFSTVSAIVGVWFGAGAMFVFLALAILYPNDRLSRFVMATKTCRAAKPILNPPISWLHTDLTQRVTGGGPTSLVSS